MSTFKTKIVEKIDAFLARSGMSPSALGWETVHDTRAIPNIKKGKASMRTIERIETYINDYGFESEDGA